MSIEFIIFYALIGIGVCIKLSNENEFETHQIVILSILWIVILGSLLVDVTEIVDHKRKQIENDKTE